MAAPVRPPRAASLPPPTVSLYPFDVDDNPYARTNSSAPPAPALDSSHEDDDAKCSDGWPLQSQPSIVSSRTTTSESPTSDPRSLRSSTNARPSKGLRTASSPVFSNKTGHDAPALLRPDENAPDHVTSKSSTEMYSENSSEYDSLSDEDPIAYQNARQFPPRLPVGPGHWSSRLEGKASAVNNITSWVARREQAQETQSGSIPDSDVTDDYAVESSTTSSGDGIEGIWQTLNKKRARLVELRMQMGIARKELRQMRRRKDGADNAFMGLVRPLLVNLSNQTEVLHAPVSLLERRWVDMQRLGDEYHFLESNYEELEGVVDEEEEDLNRLETRFFSLLAAGQTRTSKFTTINEASLVKGNKTPSDLPDILLGISCDGPQEDLHPLYVELKSVVGDLTNAKEDYHDLCWAKNHYEEELNLKKRTGQRIPKRLLEFLEEFPMEEATMKRTVNDLQNEVDRLRRLCEEKNVMRKHMSARMVHLLDPSTKFEDIVLDDQETILEKHKTLAHARFPELLSQPDHVLAKPQPLTPLGALKQVINLPDTDPEKQLKKRLASKEYAISTLLQDTIGGTDKAGYVNRWLLQSLRICPINLVMLHTIFLSSCLLKIRDPWRWQCDVLHYWWKDDTMEHMPMPAATSTYLKYSSQQDTTPQISAVTSTVGLRFG